MNTQNELLTAALGYAARGWPVLPLHTPHDGHCDCGKPGCKSPGKHPRTKNGLKDATTDAATIERWWTLFPEANVGLATGAASGFDALDVDPRHGGDDSLATLLASGGNVLPNTVEAVTGSSGRHLLFKHINETRSSVGKLGPGLDFKADGGYIVVPPSLHVSGRRYEWEENRRPDTTAIAEPPARLLELIQQPKRKVAEPVPNAIPEGERNSTLASFAGSMRRPGMSAEAILAALLVENKQRCSPPLGDAEVREIAESISQYESAPTEESETLLAALTHAELVTGQVEPVPWLVDGLLPTSGVGIVGGDSGIGKSWLALHLAQCVAAGAPFLGHFDVRCGSVVVFDAESARSLISRRLTKLFNGLQAEWSDCTADIPLRVVMGALPVQSAEQVERLIRFLDDLRPTLVVVDPLIHSIGGDENSSAETSRFFETLRSVQRQVGCAFVLVHHARKRSYLAPSEAGQMLRGSSAILGCLDSHLFLRKLRTGRLLCEHDKSRHAEPVPDFIVEIADLDDRTTVVRYGGEAEEAVEKSEVAAAVAKRALADAGGRLTRNEIVDQAKGEKLPERTVGRALNDGVAAGWLAKERRGKAVAYSLTDPLE